MIEMIPVASNIGSFYPGCEKGPVEILNKIRGLESFSDLIVSPTIFPNLDRFTSVEDALIDLFKRIQSSILSTLQKNHFPLILGGDHSIGIATWATLSNVYRELGLIWIDAHLDSHTLTSSHSGKHHGMPLNALLGGSQWPFDESFFLKTALNPEHVCIIGARSYEKEEYEFLSALGVKIFFADQVHREGIDAILSQAVSIARRAKGGFGISFDYDSLDPLIAPGVSTPVRNGLLLTEFLQSFNAIDLSGLVGLEAVEYNPLNDQNSRTLSVAVDVLSTFIDSVITSQNLVYT